MDVPSVQMLASATMRTAFAVRSAFNPEGLNIIQSNGEAATQTVPHVHVHVVPRWRGDSVRDPWPDNVDWTPVELDEIAREVRASFQGTA